LLFRHRDFKKKETLFSRNACRKKRIFALSETNKTRFPALGQESWLVSRLRKGREK